MQALQDCVARSVGVAMIYTAPATHAAEEPYREFLERLAAEAAARGTGRSQAAAGRFVSIPLQVMLKPLWGRHTLYE